MSRSSPEPVYGGIVCPTCGSATGVYDTRGRSQGRVTRRRRKCHACGYRFTTFEVVAEDIQWMSALREHIRAILVGANAEIAQLIEQMGADDWTKGED